MTCRNVRRRLSKPVLAWEARLQKEWGIALAGGTVCLLVLGFYLRLDGFSGSLWLDEFGTLWAVERDITTTVSRSLGVHGQSPFYYILVWIPLHLFGESEVALRAPSLLFGCAFVVVLYYSARTLGGPRSGVFALLLGWFSFPVVRASVEARPYSLALLAVAIAVAGFQRAVLTGEGKARTLWVLGGATVAWTHYLQYLVVVGLFLSYALLPRLRTKYSVRSFVTDGLWQLGLVALCTPQVLTLFSRRQTLVWLDQANYLAFMFLLAPLVVALLLGELRDSRDTHPSGVALRQALWVAMLTHVCVLDLAAIAGVNLLYWRYLQAILVPGILLAATAFARLRPSRAIAALVWFAVLSGSDFIQAKKFTGTYSSIGGEGWRDAVTALSERLEQSPDTLVLFRSGFVEEDSLPLGSPPEITLAPLRNPGHDYPHWRLKSLTFRWNNAMRDSYFEKDLTPVLAHADMFYLLSSAFSPEPELYLGKFVAWVERKWPGRFQSVTTRFGAVKLLSFRTGRENHPEVFGGGRGDPGK